ncbi:MAG: OFA family MFS transporter [Candidatus Thermoplasmatota archaeon]|nr:OFA family MFS transporter [Candidatus Thermoplasmatota archaeon]MBS3790989.1 OFA family MFS transporter [Candidatus Thermoplasmatota archaeon]
MSEKTDKEILGYSRWIVLIAAFLAMALVSPYEYAWSSISPLVAESNGWSLDQMGLVFTLFVLFQSGASFPTGVLRDRYGPRVLTIVGGTLSGLGLYSLTFGHLPFLTILYGIIGSFGAGMVYSNAVNTGNKWFPDKRGLSTGLIAGAFSWGSIPFILWIRSYATVDNYQFILTSIAIIVGVIIIICGLIIKDPPNGWRPKSWSPSDDEGITRPSTHQYTIIETVKTWQFWILYISFFLISGAGLMTISKIVEYSGEVGFIPIVGTVAATGLTITNGAGRIVMGRISDKIGREITMMLSFVLTGAFLLIIAQTNNSILFLISVMTALFFWGPLFSLFPAITGHYYGEKNAAGNYGLLYSAKMAGGFYGGYVAAILMKGYGFRLTFMIGGLMAIVAGVLVLLTKYKPPKL